jgi:hypothetical protein
MNVHDEKNDTDDDREHACADGKKKREDWYGCMTVTQQEAWR